MKEQRRLAAIVSADVAGYSRLMGRDESGTLAALKALRQEVVDPAITSHGGRIVKTTGDGLLLEFPSVVNAVRCSVEVQTAMAVRTAEVAEDRRIAFRIGINLGDIIVEGDDIFGDGVNIAARLQEIATLGGVCVSSRVHDDVRDRLETVFEDAGAQTLKNIARPVQVWRWQPGTAVPRPAPVPAALPLPDKPSIALLPFQNMSGDPEQEYFADGIVEDIITALSRFKSLFVIARNSSFSYKGKSPDIRQVGRELGVRYVLEGSVRKAGGKVRITSQLIDSESGTHIWADRFDGPLEDIFALQDQVTTRVVGAIAPRLNQAEIERARRKSGQNLDAYDCFLRALAQSYIVSRPAQEEAARLLHQAIALDPGFSTPYGLVTGLLTIRKAQGWVTDAAAEEVEVRRLAEQVTVIGQDDALALSWAGFALVYVCREFDTGAALIDQALSLNQNLAQGWANRALVSTFFGAHETAIEEVGHVFRLSPVEPEMYRSEVTMAFAHLCLGHYGESARWATQALARQASFVPAMRVATAAQALAGNLTEARRVLEQMCRLDPSLTQTSFRSKTFFRRGQDVERFIEGFHLAGLPE